MQKFLFFDFLGVQESPGQLKSSYRPTQSPVFWHSDRGSNPIYLLWKLETLNHVRTFVSLLHSKSGATFESQHGFLTSAVLYFRSRSHDLKGATAIDTTWVMLLWLRQTEASTNPTTDHLAKVAMQAVNFWVASPIQGLLPLPYDTLLKCVRLTVLFATTLDLLFVNFLILIIWCTFKMLALNTDDVLVNSIATNTTDAKIISNRSWTTPPSL